MIANYSENKFFTTNKIDYICNNNNNKNKKYETHTNI